MPTNAEIRTINFAQGINVTTTTVLDDNGEKIVINNASNQSTGLTFADNIYREVIITYSLRRRTDATALAESVLVEGGTIKLSSNPDAVLLADRWFKKHQKEDEGTSPGVSFSLDITDDGLGNAVVDLLYSSTELVPGDGHECFMSYSLTSFLV